MLNTSDVMERYQDLREPIKKSLNRTVYYFPIMMIFSLLFSTAGFMIYFIVNNDCNIHVKRIIIAVAIVYILDVLFIGFNFYYIRKVFILAIDTLRKSETDLLIEDRFIVPQVTLGEDPMDFKATEVMDTICSTCLSTLYLVISYILTIVLAIMGLILSYTEAADCEGTTFQYYTRVYFITIIATIIVRVIWCIGYLSFPKMVSAIFVYEQRRWNAMGNRSR